MSSYKPIIHTVGSGKPIVGIVGGMHGNESGLQIIEYVQQKVTPKRGTIIFIQANPYAIKKHVRFIDADLNRIFPGNPEGNIEEQLASQLLSIGKECDFLLDLHSCSMESEAFCILRDPTQKQLSLAKMTGLPNIVIYPLELQKGTSFIDHVPCGIGLELGLHTSEVTIKKGITAILRVLSELKVIDAPEDNAEIKQSVFRIKKHLYRNKDFVPRGDIQNFQLIKKNEILGKNPKGVRYAKEDFYPIMYNQKSYNKILCWAAKRI